jgi:8-oxo-dGTP diphosphatase
MTVEPQKLLTVIEYEYPAFHLSMECWLCHITNGTPVLVEHEAARWLLEEQIDSVDWLPADRTILDLVRRELSKESVY